MKEGGRRGGGVEDGWWWLFDSHFHFQLTTIKFLDLLDSKEFFYTFKFFLIGQVRDELWSLN
jgi:hypothetical protein